MAALNSKLQGFKSQFSFTPPSGTSIQFKSLQDFELSIKGQALDASDHDNNGFKSFMTGLLEWDGNIKGCYIDGDASQGDILTAVLNQSVCAGVFFPVINSGSMSLTGSFTITDWKLGAKNNGIQTLDITIKGYTALTQVSQV